MKKMVKKIQTYSPSGQKQFKEFTESCNQNLQKIVILGLKTAKKKGGSIAFLSLAMTISGS